MTLDDAIVKEQEIIQAYKDTLKYCTTERGVNTANRVIDKCTQYQEWFKELKDLKTEPKYGTWDFIGDQCFSCSSCGEVYTQKQFEILQNHTYESIFPKFCPHCGAIKIVDKRLESE